MWHALRRALSQQSSHICGDVYKRQLLNEEKVDIGDTKVDIENGKVDIQDKKVDIDLSLIHI